MIKICGVCRPADAALAAAAGATYVGVILAPGRRRSRSLDEAAAIFAAAAPARRVGVFINPAFADVTAACARLALDVVQLHGSESPSWIAALRPQTTAALWKSVTLATAGDLERAIAAYGNVVDGMLLDSAAGGSGRAFDWTLAEAARDRLPRQVALIVAGGLTPENVSDVVAAIKPDVVDVSSGVEAALCEKSKEKIDGFVRNALR